MYYPLEARDFYALQHVQISPSDSRNRTPFSPAGIRSRAGILALVCSFLFGLSLNVFGQAGTAPSTYTAYSGTDAKTIPAAPALGAANSVIVDPTFGSRILRVTDANTSNGESFIPTDAGFHRTWNADSTAIKLTGPHGDGYWLEFNPSTFKVGDGSAKPAVHPVSFGATWEWSTVDPNIIYYLSGSKIAKYNKATGVSTTLGGPSTGDPLAYTAVVIGLDNWVCAAAGTGVQDTYTKIFCINPISPSVSKFIDVVNKTINGVAQGDPNWPTSASGQTIGIHDISGGTGASWLEITFHQQSWGANGGAVLNLATNTWSEITNKDEYWSGHVSMGNGIYANSSGSEDGRDSRGILLRDPNNAMNSSEYTFVYQPSAPSNGWCDADHNSWLNSVNNPKAPILISRYNGSAACAFAWNAEIDAAATDGSNTVWRFAHNHNGGATCYYAQAFAQISNDGNWALFSSYWDAMLGPDTSFGCTTRIDTFIVDLSHASSTTTGSTSNNTSTNSTSPSSPTTTSTTPTTPSTTTTTAPTTTTGTSTVTRVEQSASAIAYAGTWYPNTNVADSGGTATMAMDTGAKGTLTFTGTGVNWIGEGDPWSGIANVYVDGVLKGQVDTYNSTTKPKSILYSVSGLTSGSHTIAIQPAGKANSASGGMWVWVDAFDITSGTASATSSTPTSTTTGSTSSSSGSASSGSTGSSMGAPTTVTTPTGSNYHVEQTSKAVVYAGTWYTNNSSVNSGSSAALAMDATSKVTFTFTGTAVTWLGLSDPWSGLASVYIDGVLKQTVDTYSSVQKAQNVQYTISGLSWGTHTIAIQPQGKRDSSSQANWIWVDGFNYTGAALTTANVVTSSSSSVAMSGTSVISSDAKALTIGYAQLTSATAVPSGLAIVDVHQDGVLVSEAGMQGAELVQNGRFYAEVGGPVNTGFALANPNDSAATVSFYFTDSSGNSSGKGTITIPGRAQMAHFLSESPFSAAPSVSGTFSFNSSLPVAVEALRGYTNQRNDFLVTTLPVTNTDTPTPATLFFPHVADGAGWATEFVLTNPSSSTITGVLSFFQQGAAGQTTNPLTLTINGKAVSSIPYSIPAQSAVTFTTADNTSSVHVGSAQMTPDPANISPDGVAIFNYTENGIRVSEAGVPAVPAATTLRMYAEAQAGVQTGVAIANAGNVDESLTLELTNLDGTTTGLSGSLTVPAMGQTALFLRQIPGFELLQSSFQGFLRIAANDQLSIAAMGLRGQVNERNDYLITTTQPVSEDHDNLTDLVFPQVADGNGYATQLITFDGSSSEPATGSLAVYGQSGSVMPVAFIKP